MRNNVSWLEGNTLIACHNREMKAIERERKRQQRRQAVRLRRPRRFR